MIKQATTAQKLAQNDQVTLHECQEIIASDTHRFRVVNCGRRFGKTVVACEEIIAKALYTNNGSIAYLAPTYQQARDIIWNTLKKRLRPIAKSINESRLEIIITNRVPSLDQDSQPVLDKNNNVIFGESRIVLRGWESVETLRGQHFDLLVPDEVAMMGNFWTGWQEVLLPTLTDTAGDVLFLSTPKGFNHFYDLFNMEHKSADWKSFHFTSYDNPHLKTAEIETIRSNMPADSFAQEYLGEFRKMQGLVYPEFSREKHLLTEEEVANLDKINFVETICGVDFGYTNPACVLQIKKTADNVYYVLNEWYHAKKTTAQIIEITKKFEPNIVYPDPAEPDRIKEMSEAGINIREVSKEIAAGIDRVREAFLQGRIKIHPANCPNLVNELETYHYPDKKYGVNEQEKPTKEHDHAVDPLRYVIYNNNTIVDTYTGETYVLYQQDYS